MSDKKKKLSVIEQLTAGANDQAGEPAAPLHKSGSSSGGFRFQNAAAHSIDPTKILHVSPEDCTPFAYNDREFSSLAQADIQDLIDGFMAAGIGQIEPCIARKKDNGKYEIIAGTRRLKAALWVAANTPVKFKLQIVLREIPTDIEALQMMRGENSYNPPSPYERAVSTKRHIDELFNNNISEYARVMNVSKGSISELLAFTQVPDVFLDAYGSRRVIPIQHALTIRTRLNKNEALPAWKKALLAKATDLAKASEKLEPSQVITTLLKAADSVLKQKKAAPEKRNLAIGGKKNALAVTAFNNGSITFQLDAICREHLDETLKVLQDQLRKK